MTTTTTSSMGTGQRFEALDGLRGLASFYIFLHHYVHIRIDPLIPGASRPLIFGQAAVMLFFLLSGFVIYASTAGSNPNFTARWYLVRRIRRIYPPFLAALLVTAVLARMHSHGWSIDNVELLGNLAMLQDRPTHPGWWFEPFCKNTALWSLAYEWWFYILFLMLWPAFKDRPGTLRYIVAAVGIGAIGLFFIRPNQPAVYLAYFPIWWVGVEIAREWLESCKITIRRQLFPMAVVAVIGFAWWIAPAFTGLQVDGGLYGYPMIQFRQYTSAMLICAVGYGLYCVGWPFCGMLLHPFRFLAPISYAIYILHEPVVHFAAEARLTPNAFTDVLWVVPVLFGVSWLIESPLQKLVNRYLR